MNNHIFDNDTSTNEDSSMREFSIQSVRDNTKILETDNNWNPLLYKEALCIERKNPAFNTGLAASRQLKLFK